ncbi:MAG: hypothetical protein AB1429_14735 [Pseudomonadota bacterium]|jgi:hypothetical protein
MKYGIKRQLLSELYYEFGVILNYASLILVAVVLSCAESAHAQTPEELISQGGVVLPAEFNDALFSAMADFRKYDSNLSCYDVTMRYGADAEVAFNSRGKWQRGPKSARHECKIGIVYRVSRQGKILYKKYIR